MAEKEKKEEKIVDENENQEKNPDSAKMRAELMARFEEVKNKNRSLNSMQIMNENKTEDGRIKIIQELLGRLDKMGVNLQDKDSINQFLQSLEQQDPDIRELFEYAFNNLMSNQE